MNDTLQLDQVRPGVLTSRCGRYRVTLRMPPEQGEWLCHAYWYGFLLYRTNGGRSSDVALARMQSFLCDHRRHLLPKVANFELWASRHYNIDLAGVAGALARRDRVRRTIRNVGDGNLGLHFEFATRPLTIQQAYSYLYENIDPEAPETSFAAITPPECLR